jgi:CheY-like chemotaxis protein
MIVNRPKVLVVDDMPKLRDAYARNIERAGITVASAGSKEAAIEAVGRCTYHVALVDIMLSSDEDEDRSGFDVIRAIKALGEGTRCIAISGYPGYSAPAEAVNIGVDRYIPKAEIHNPPDYVEPVRQEIQKCELRRFGLFNDLREYLAAQREDYHIWESQCLPVLGVNASEFHQALDRLVGAISPLLPRVGGSLIKDVKAEGSRVQISGWSKALGVAVDVELSRRDQGTERSGEIKQEYGGVFCTIVPTDAARSEFMLRAADVKRKKRPRDRGRSTLA